MEHSEIEIGRGAARQGDLLLRVWILLSSFAVCAGWGLSALGQLNLYGYAAVGVVCLFCAKLLAGSDLNHLKNVHLRFPWRRFRRLLPALYLILVAASLVGGLIHSPNNHDAITYRFPRVLHWADEGRWHWIDTPNSRMNFSACNFEWFMTPIYLLTRSDRFFFLINLTAYLFLPGLVFGVFRRLGLSERAAWNWMWILPAGFCYAMQAGGIANDGIGAVFILASVYCALKAKETGRLDYLWFCGLSAGLATGIKTVNLPLLLPCFVAAIPALGLLKKKVASTILVAFAVLAVSYFPNALLNSRLTGSWGGDPSNEWKCLVVKPLVGLVGDGIELVVGNVSPPIFPFARELGQALDRHISKSFFESMRADFPRFVIGDLFTEIPMEDVSGIGSATCFLLLAGWLGARVLQRNGPGRRNRNAKLGLIVGLAAWCAGIFYMTHLATEHTARLLAPYYPLLFLPFLLSPGYALLVRQRWWKTLAALCILAVMPGMILTPSRPLFPAGWVLDALHERYSENRLITRAHTVYEVYGNRNASLLPLLEQIPSDVKRIGLIGGSDEEELSLWRPYGHRSVVSIFGKELLHPQLEWVIVKKAQVEAPDGTSDRWLAESGGTLVASKQITCLARQGKEDWLVVRFPAKSLPRAGG